MNVFIKVYFYFNSAVNYVRVGMEPLREQINRPLDGRTSCALYVTTMEPIILDLIPPERFGKVNIIDITNLKHCLSNIVWYYIYFIVPYDIEI